MKTTLDLAPMLLTSEDVARLLSVSKWTLWRMVRAGVIPQPARYTRKTVRWFSADVAAHLAEVAALANAPLAPYVPLGGETC